MGIKSLKDYFQIEHIVQLDSRGVCIGSGYVSDLIVIDPKTGVVKAKTNWESTLNDSYPSLKEADPKLILELLTSSDTFKKSIPVFTYNDANIIELMCEELGYPNTTHCGQLMYENTHFKTKAEAVAKAKRDAKTDLHYANERNQECEAKLNKSIDDLLRAHEVLSELMAQFPEENS